MDTGLEEDIEYTVGYFACEKGESFDKTKSQAWIKGFYDYVGSFLENLNN